jgi:fucose 4-O-acetylase-like acetyltransferase
MTIAAESQLADAPVSPKRRVAYLDNARFYVMILVVIGHPLLHLSQNHLARAIYIWIYLFHMPLFALISGYISRNFVGTRKQLRRTVSTLVVPYLIVETSFQLLARHYGKTGPLMLLSPKWVAWFLAALFIWRLTTPLWRALRHPILVSVLISLAIPLTNVPNVLAMPKTLGMLPFYVIGMQFTMSRFKQLATTRVRVVSVVFLLATAVYSWFAAPQWHLTLFKWRHFYSETHLYSTWYFGMAHRAVLLAVGVAMCVAVLSLVPWRRSWTSPMGERTLYCYLLHGFVIMIAADQWHVFTPLRAMGDAGVWLTIGTAIVLALALMTKPVAVVFRPLFEPKLKWLFRKRALPLRNQTVAAGLQGSAPGGTTT